jgi:cold-inducible RNA-binding protein
MKNIFVGNLSFGTTEQEVRSLFETFGAVDRASIATDRETGKSRGFAFVEMPNADEGERAINELSGKQVGGRALTVNEARPKGEGGGGRDRDRGGSRQNRW